MEQTKTQENEQNERSHPTRAGKTGDLKYSGDIHSENRKLRVVTVLAD